MATIGTLDKVVRNTALQLYLVPPIQKTSEKYVLNHYMSHNSIMKAFVHHNTQLSFQDNLVSFSRKTRHMVMSKLNTFTKDKLKIVTN